MMRFALIVILALAGCRDDLTAARPDPVPITAESTAFFCQMNLVEMRGPKAQIHLQGMEKPLFFARVMDGIAYMKNPEQIAPINAFYVSDMARAASWDDPGADNWMPAEDAFFVVGSDVLGGMDAPEIAPFSTREAAQAFQLEHGGEILGLADIPVDLVLGAGADNEGS